MQRESTIDHGKIKKETRFIFMMVLDPYILDQYPVFSINIIPIITNGLKVILTQLE